MSWTCISGTARSRSRCRSWASGCGVGAVALVAALAVLCQGCSAASPARPVHVRLQVGPGAAPYDTPVQVTLSGLPPSGLVTLQARTLDAQGRPWQSAARLRASDAGTLNLATAVPVSGSYRTADAAGLLWSLRPAFRSSPHVQFIPPGQGYAVRLRALAGGHVLAAATLIRQTRVRGSIQTVRRDGMAGTLFTPARTRPGAPAVMVIGGSEGGEETLTAAALALIGYPALALGYFEEPGLPACLCSIPLEYFARAVRWLRAQPAAHGRRVVLLGASRGAEAALLIASYQPHLVDAVIANSPSSGVNGAFSPAGRVSGPAWTFHGRPLLPGAPIPVGRIRIPLLMGDGGADAVWESSGSAYVIMLELTGSGDHAPHVNLLYPDAGHAYFGVAPYFPYSGYGFDGHYLVLGGRQQANAIATERFWAAMIRFLDDPQAS